MTINLSVSLARLMVAPAQSRFNYKHIEKQFMNLVQEVVNNINRPVRYGMAGEEINYILSPKGLTECALFTLEGTTISISSEGEVTMHSDAFARPLFTSAIGNAGLVLQIAEGINETTRVKSGYLNRSQTISICPRPKQISLTLS